MAQKKRTGDFAQTSVTLDLSITGTLTSGSANVSALSSTEGLAAGQPISGTGIPNGTTILSISGSTLMLSAMATAAGTLVALTVTGETQIIGLMEWTLSWKRKTVDATTTDDAAYESSLGSSKSWTVKAKYAYLMGDQSQMAFVRAAITDVQDAQPWNFFPDDKVGDDAFVGLAYIEGIDISAGVGKLIGQDVSLKGTGPLAVDTQLAPVANANTINGEQAEV